jgi:4a-hydroxytetrahydrobiopterin dehydratase
MPSQTTLKVYTEEEARSRIATELPFWSVEQGRLCRRYRTSGWKASLLVANAIGHLAESAWHHPELCLAYGMVTVQLSTHKAGGLTDKDFALARKIEEVVYWEPAREGGALTGTPNHEPRFRYIDYDRLDPAA